MRFAAHASVWVEQAQDSGGGLLAGGHHAEQVVTVSASRDADDDAAGSLDSLQAIGLKNRQQWVQPIATTAWAGCTRRCHVRASARVPCRYHSLCRLPPRERVQPRRQRLGLRAVALLTRRGQLPADEA